MKNLFIILFFLFCSAFGSPKVLKIGSGSIMKGYYSIGLDLCKTFTSANKGIICEVIPTAGGVENLSLLKSGKIDLALVQSDVILEAYEGRGFYKKTGRIDSIRQVLNLYDELFTVIVKTDSKIKSFSELSGKKVSLLPLFSDNITYQSIKALYSDMLDPIYLNEMNYENSINDFCNGRIDALVMTIGHPNSLISLIANKCPIEFISIESDKILNLLSINKAFRKISIDRPLYVSTGINYQTVGVTAVLVTNENMDFKILDRFIGKFHNTVKEFKHSNYMLNNVDINYFADVNTFIIPKHPSVRNR